MKHILVRYKNGEERVLPSEATEPFLIAAHEEEETNSKLYGQCISPNPHDTLLLIHVMQRHGERITFDTAGTLHVDQPRTGTNVRSVFEDDTEIGAYPDEILQLTDTISDITLIED